MAQLRLIIHRNRIRYLRIKLGMLGILMILVLMATYHSVP